MWKMSSSSGGELEKPKMSLIPVENFWIRKCLAVDVNVLTLRGVSVSMNNPYITIGFLGGERHEIEPAICHDDQTSCDFYQRVSFDLELPGQGSLVMQLWSRNLTGSVLVGEAQVDIEDRHLALMHRHLREQCNQQWIKQNLSPPETIEVHVAEEHQKARMWKQPSKLESCHSSKQTRRASTAVFNPKNKKAAVAFDPFLCPKKPAPIEPLPLYANSVQIGGLRTWIDISTSQDPIPETTFLSQNLGGGFIQISFYYFSDQKLGKMVPFQMGWFNHN